MADLSRRVLLARELAAEHAALLGERMRITDELERFHSAPGEVSLDRLGEHLVSLRNHLRRHFELEERDGYLGLDDDMNPSTARVATAFVAEHRDFEARIDRLSDQVLRTAAANTPLPDDFEADLRKCLDELASHEVRENELFQELAYRSLGTGD